jgi:hypothetical protein
MLFNVPLSHSIEFQIKGDLLQFFHLSKLVPVVVELLADQFSTLPFEVNIISLQLVCCFVLSFRCIHRRLLLLELLQTYSLFAKSFILGLIPHMFVSNFLMDGLEYVGFLGVISLLRVLFCQQKALRDKNN